MIAEVAVETKAEITIERATPELRDALVSMYRAFEPKGASLGLPPRRNPERWLASLAAYPNFVARLGERVVGHAVLCPCGSSAEIAVFVHQEFRGRGLGRQLLNALVDEARQLGLWHVWATTDLDNVPMLRLAHALGFRCGQDPATFSLDVAASPKK